MNLRKISLGLLFLILALVIVPGALAYPTYHPPASSDVVKTCDPGCHGVPAATFCVTCHKGFPTFVLSISATPTSVTAGTAIPVTFTVRNGGSLGPLVNGALVSLSGAGLPSGTSGSTGSLGTVTISVNATSSGSILATATKTPSYTSGTTTLTVSSPAPAANGTITGRVTNASSASGISGATVIAGGISANTNATGYYSISIAPGSYNVAASASGYVNAAMAGQVVTSNAIKTVNFALSPATTPTSTGKFSVTFIVTDSVTGKPIHDAEVSLKGKEIETNKSGNAIFTSVAPGTYKYEIEMDGYREIEGRISVVGDTTIAIKLVKKSHRRTYNSRSHDED